MSLHHTNRCRPPDNTDDAHLEGMVASWEKATDSPVGRVTSVRKNEREGLWKSDWELPKIAANATTFEQLDVGLLRGISVGGSLDMASITVDNEDDVSRGRRVCSTRTAAL